MCRCFEYLKSWECLNRKTFHTSSKRNCNWSIEPVCQWVGIPRLDPIISVCLGFAWAESFVRSCWEVLSSYFFFMSCFLLNPQITDAVLYKLYLMSASLEFPVTRLSSFMFWWHLTARDKLMATPRYWPIRDENRGQWPIRALLRSDIVTSPGTHSTVLRAYVRHYEENCKVILKQVCPLIFRFLSLKHISCLFAEQTLLALVLSSSWDEFILTLPRLALPELHCCNAYQAIQRGLTGFSPALPHDF